MLQAGTVTREEASNLGLPPPETTRGRSRPQADHGNFNPLTHEYHASATPRDLEKAKGRRTIKVHDGHALTPRTLCPCSATHGRHPMRPAPPRPDARLKLSPPTPIGAGINPLTLRLDPLNSTKAAMRAYDPRLLQPLNLHIVPRDKSPPTPRLLQTARPSLAATTATAMNKGMGTITNHPGLAATCAF